MSDLTGFSQLGRNLAVTWIVQFIVLIAGFVVPRQISDSLGQEALGIWDLGWATLRYLALGNMGVGSVLSRFTARHRAQGNSEGLSQTASIVTIWQSLIVVLAIIVAYSMALGISSWVDFSKPGDQSTAQTVILVLGLSLAAKMIANPSGALISGFHRWDIQNGITAAEDVLIAVSLVSLLLLGATLEHLSYAVLAAACLGSCCRFFAARKIAPEVRFRPSLWESKKAVELLRFGVKTLVNSAASVLVYQTVIVLLAGFAGPAALAVYNRGIALVGHCERIITKAANMMMPISSSLQALEQNFAARELLGQVGTYSLGVAMPMMIALAVFGDLIVEVWMGPGYANAPLMWALALGGIVRLSQVGTFNVLVGMNAHGKVALMSLLAVIASMAVMLPLATHLGWSPVVAAIVVGTCLSIAKGLVIPLYLKHRFGISLTTYLFSCIVKPIIWNLPLFIAAVLARGAFDSQQWLMCFGLLCGGGLITLAIYWRWMLPQAAKTTILNGLRSLRQAVA